MANNNVWMNDTKMKMAFYNVVCVQSAMNERNSRFLLDFLCSLARNFKVKQIPLGLHPLNSSICNSIEHLFELHENALYRQSARFISERSRRKFMAK